MFLHGDSQSWLAQPSSNLFPPPIQEPRSGDGASQAQTGEPPPPPLLPPFNRDPNESPDQASPRDDENAWNLPAFASNAWDRFWASLPADKPQFLFNSLLVIVGFLQWHVYRTQTRIMRETREISTAALGRPHVFFEFASHTFEDWRKGRESLWFAFRLVNYGTSPAIIRYVYARAFLSRGPGTQEDRKYTSIKGFPEEREFEEFATESSSIYVMKVKGSDVNFEVFFERGRRFRDHPFVISAREQSDLFGTFAPVDKLVGPKDGSSQPWHETYLYDVTAGNSSNGGWVLPWLVGQVVYDDTFGRSHHTNFCVRANSDGSVEHEEGGTYDERT